MEATSEGGPARITHDLCESPEAAARRATPFGGLHPRQAFHPLRFRNFVDVLRLAADEGDRSRPILCDWSVLSDTMDPVPSCGVTVQPGDRLGDPRGSTTSSWSEGFSRKSRTSARLHPLPPARGGGRAASRRPLHRRLHPPSRRADAGLPGLREHGSATPTSSSSSTARTNLRPDLRRGRRPPHLRRRAELRHLAAYLVEKHVGRAQASKSLHIMIIDDAMRRRSPARHPARAEDRGPDGEAGAAPHAAAHRRAPSR